ncbi:MAG: carboxylating nicotinate-nucleotide diphosphorylase [Candidatus Omnitrophica bacterium]|nr:carboxylating nicotinate-nucleotide diphosphorylase [Candidatus Omnitrophota bacterium]
MLSNRENKLKIPEISSIISAALAEDIGSGDITSLALVNNDFSVDAKIIAKQDNIVICGIELVREVFRRVDRRITVVSPFKDGAKLKKNAIVFTIKGPAKAILAAERTALNFLGRLSGIATKTSRFVEKAKPYNIKVLDTRKTTAGLRLLEKYAIKVGGGYNHRFGLFDQVLIKDNHISVLKKISHGCTLDEIVNLAKKRVPAGILIEIETDNLKEFRHALKAVPDIIMLDNMTITQIKKAVFLRNKINKKVKLEVSGNVNEKNIVKFAGSGVNLISIGSLTHSADSVDFSLKII